MSNIVESLKKITAATALACAAAGCVTVPGAGIGGYGNTQARPAAPSPEQMTRQRAAYAAAESARDCNTLASNRDLSEYPSSNAAFVRNNHIGCKFVIDPAGRHALVQTFDFSVKDRSGRAPQELQYASQLDSASRLQTRTDQYEARRGGTSASGIGGIIQNTQTGIGAIQQIQNLGTQIRNLGR